jgi:hypothetical protein
MALYFFHLSSDVASEDRVGEEFPSTEAAVAEAHKIVRELAQNQTESETVGWKLRVTDDSGADVAVLSIADGVREQLS